tara:strand:+ start:2513 stop:4354 length:1842 start_codon:yes stop_codon:yes gene_type:complete
MCGVTGCIVNEELTYKKIQKTLLLMQNRGPDNQSYRFFKFGKKFVYLFHSRLSIIDLNDRSNQPFSYNGVHLIFNGEIYNYKELKKIYLKEFSFKTQSDTEVLLYMYIKFGKNFEKKLNGMWSFAIFDENKQKLFLSRDRFGEKPMHYLTENNQFYFSSEIKNIKQLLDRKLELNLNHIRRFLVYGYKTINKYKDHFYKTLHRLEASSYIEIDSDLNFTKNNYYKVNLIQNNLSTNENIENTKELLIKSVESRMIADVPLAFCLSGGVDSTSTVSIAKKILNKNVKTYSILDDDERYNEKKNILKNVNHLEIDHQFIELKEHFNIKSLSDLIQYHDEPLCTINFFSHSLLQKAIKQDNNKISVSGIGADEIFTGYFDHHLYLMHYLKNLGNAEYNKYKKDWSTFIQPLVNNPDLKNPDLFEIKGIKENKYRYMRYDYYSSFLVNEFIEDQIDVNFDIDSILKNRMLNELFYETMPPALDNEDLNSMYYSIENRSPFLNHDLVDYVYSIPSSQLMQRGYSKYILRESIKDIAVEEVRIDRVKKGFNASADSFLKNSATDLLDLMNSDSSFYDIINKEKVISFFNENNFQENWDKKFLFNLINTKLFMDLNDDLL